MLEPEQKKGAWTLKEKIFRDRTGSTNRKVPHWRCVCDCGRKKTVREDNLVANKSRSCGCKRETQESRVRRNYGFE